MILYALNDTTIVVLHPEDISLSAPIAVQVSIKAAGYVLFRLETHLLTLADLHLRTTSLISSMPSAKYRYVRISDNWMQA